MSLLESPTINPDLVDDEHPAADPPAALDGSTSTSTPMTPARPTIKTVFEKMAPSADPVKIFTDLADRLAATGVRVTVELIDHNSLSRVVRPDPGAATTEITHPLAETQALFAGGGEAIVGPTSIAVAVQGGAVNDEVRTTSGTEFLGSLICDFGPAGPRDGDLDVLELLVAATVTAIHRQRRADTLADKVANLEQALASNRAIGVAMGILSVRHRISPEQAFELLRVASQCSNRKLRELAAEVISTGELDGSEHHLRLIRGN